MNYSIRYDSSQQFQLLYYNCLYVHKNIPIVILVDNFIKILKNIYFEFLSILKLNLRNVDINNLKVICRTENLFDGGKWEVIDNRIES